MALVKEYPYEDGLAVPVHLFEEAIYHFECYYKATTPMAQAHQLQKLAEKVSALKTWHPGYDVDHDTMPWDREDEEYG